MTQPSQRPELFPGVTITEGGLIPTDRSLPPVPLKRTNVRANIVGPVCAVEVEQHFHNTHTQPIEALYVFPLPENAAVTDLTLTLGERTITGTIQEKEAARREYQAAAQAGQGAALLEQARPNIFSVAVANIQPDEQVQVTLRFNDRLEYDDGGYTFALPTVVMPRYTPKSQAESAPPSAPLLPDDSREGHTLAIRVEIDAGKLDGIKSPSHPIEVEHQRGGRAVVKLSQSDVLPNKDFVLRYQVAAQQPTAAAFTYRSAGQPGTVLLTLTPQGVVAPDAIVPRELLFVFDRSGSMSGTAIVQARNALRACLRALNDNDVFNIFPFDHQVDQFAPDSQPFTQASIDRADAYIDGISARGGTEILQAIKRALAQPADPERLRVIVFLTDGGVGNEDEVLRELRGAMGEARVFAFGIGSAVNRFLLNKLAEVGRGSAEYLLPDEEIEAGIQRFQRRASAPLLTDVTIDWGGARVTDALPAPLPDLYAGQPLAVLARFHSTGTTSVRLRGRTHRGPFEQALEVEWPAATPDRSPLWMALPQIWARARVDHLISEGRHNSAATSPVRDEVLSLGLNYRLLTPYTSFVAIEERRDAHGQRTKAERVQVPIHLPEGTEREAFEAPQPVFASMLMHRMGGAAPAAPAPQAKLRGFGAMVREGINMLGGTRGGDDAAESAPAAYAPPPPPSASASVPFPQQSAPQATTDTERALAALRYLARTQSVNGSWDNDVSATALALAAFLSGGHSDRAGSFRPQLTRAIQWLTSHSAHSAIAAWSLATLAAITDAQAHIAARDQALATLQPVDNVDHGFAAQAHHIAGHAVQTVVASALPPESLANAPGILATLLRSITDPDSAAASRRQLAALQHQSDSHSGAVMPKDATQPTIFAATALGALLWGMI